MVDFLFLNTCKTFPFRTCLHATIIFSKDLEQIFPSRRSVWFHRNTATWTRAFHQWNCSVFFTGEKTNFSLSLFWLFQCTCRFATQQNVSRENSHQHYHALSLLRQDLFLHDRFLSPWSRERTWNVQLTSHCYQVRNSVILYQLTDNFDKQTAIKTNSPKEMHIYYD